MSGAKNWLITGCSSGLGRLLAEAVLARGDQVLLTARNLDSLAELAARYPDTARIAALDVTDPAQVTAAVAAALAAFGHIDVLVNNAGGSIIGAVEEVSPEEYRAIYEANLFGPIALMRAVIPYMRARGQGRLVAVSSVGGLVPTPGMGHYSASKSALEAICESLQGEVQAFGIKVLIVEPAGLRTNMSQSVRYAAGLSPAYAQSSGVWQQRMRQFGGKEPGDPARAALAILEAVDNPASPLRLPLGGITPKMAIGHLRGVIQNLENGAARAASIDAPPAVK